MKPCPALEYGLILLVVAGLTVALVGLGKATSKPLETLSQALEGGK